MPALADPPPPRRRHTSTGPDVPFAGRRALVLWQLGEARRKTRLRRRSAW